MSASLKTFEKNTLFTIVNMQNNDLKTRAYNNFMETDSAEFFKFRQENFIAENIYSAPKDYGTSTTIYPRCFNSSSVFS